MTEIDGREFGRLLATHRALSSLRKRSRNARVIVRWRRFVNVALGPGGEGALCATGGALAAREADAAWTAARACNTP